MGQERRSHAARSEPWNFVRRRCDPKPLDVEVRRFQGSVRNRSGFCHGRTCGRQPSTHREAIAVSSVPERSCKSPLRKGALPAMMLSLKTILVFATLAADFAATLTGQTKSLAGMPLVDVEVLAVNVETGALSRT